MKIVRARCSRDKSWGIAQSGRYQRAAKKWRGRGCLR